MMEQVHTCVAMGITLEYIITDSGNYLYYQKISKSPQQWVKEIKNKLIKSKCNNVNELMIKYCNNNNYFNKHYYKPVSSMCQMVFELGL
jgi:dihydroneopterin aldolase